jgi:hypothetical protein
MNLDVGNEAAQIPLWEYLFRIFSTVFLQCRQREEGLKGMKKIDSTHHCVRGVKRDNSLVPVIAVHVIVYIAMSIWLNG